MKNLKFAILGPKGLMNMDLNAKENLMRKESKLKCQNEKNEK